MSEWLAARGDHAGFALLSLLGASGWFISVTMQDGRERVTASHDVWGSVSRRGSVAEVASDIFEEAMTLSGSGQRFQ